MSQFSVRFRGWVQAGTLLSNLHLPNFLKGRLYQGAGESRLRARTQLLFLPRQRREPVPLDHFRRWLVRQSTAFPIISPASSSCWELLCRDGFICGFLCPFGWLQELLHKIPTKKFSSQKLKPLRYLKYGILVVMVCMLPVLAANDVGIGDPFFCKYLCPQGVLEGAIPLSLVNPSIRAALGKLFSWKLSILLTMIVLSVLFFRPFCKWLCPLGAFYALLNRMSLFRMQVDRDKCVSCGKCAKACKMDVDVTKTPNHTECIRCGMWHTCLSDGRRVPRYGFRLRQNRETAETSKKSKSKEESP